MNNKIGDAAGRIWTVLNEKGSLTTTNLKKELDLDDFTVFAAIGWLAREDKVDVAVKGRSKTISLK